MIIDNHGIIFPLSSPAWKNTLKHAPGHDIGGHILAVFVADRSAESRSCAPFCEHEEGRLEGRVERTAPWRLVGDEPQCWLPCHVLQCGQEGLG